METVSRGSASTTTCVRGLNGFFDDVNEVLDLLEAPEEGLRADLYLAAVQN